MPRQSPKKIRAAAKAAKNLARLKIRGITKRAKAAKAKPAKRAPAKSKPAPKGRGY